MAAYHRFAARISIISSIIIGIILHAVFFFFSFLPSYLAHSAHTSAFEHWCTHTAARAHTHARWRLAAARATGSGMCHLTPLRALCALLSPGGSCPAFCLSCLLRARCHLPVSPIPAAICLFSYLYKQCHPVSWHHLASVCPFSSFSCMPPVSYLLLTVTTFVCHFVVFLPHAKFLCMPCLVAGLTGTHGGTYTCPPAVVWDMGLRKEFGCVAAGAELAFTTRLHTFCGCHAHYTTHLHTHLHTHTHAPPSLHLLICCLLIPLIYPRLLCLLYCSPPLYSFSLLPLST